MNQPTDTHRDPETHAAATSLAESERIIVADMTAQIGQSGIRPLRASTPAVMGEGALASAFAVTPLAVATIGATGAALADVLALRDGARRSVTVDRRLASLWFSTSLSPQGWTPPPAWDPIAGDYRCRDGWIRLHTNAAAHRRAALRVLGVDADKDAVAAAVASWDRITLETAIVTAGGCAAAMHTRRQWAASGPGRHVAAEPLIEWNLGSAAGNPWQGPAEVDRPLAGLKVLDLTRVLAGPVATRLLALLGAEVLRIDPPSWDEPGIVPDVVLGKRCARMDLHDAGDYNQFLDLLAGADIIVHGYRPGALDGLGLDTTLRHNIRPGLIDVSLDAYGWTGPWRTRRGFDSLVQMSTGIAEEGMRRYQRETPTPLPVQALDHSTGYLMAYAVINALTHHAHTGRGAIARLSLARTAHLLTSYDRGPHSGVDESIIRTDADLTPDIEHTSWGPAQRVRPPLTIDGVDITTDIPAHHLGADAPRW
ncbi:CoA transferase [Gordonia soli]|uniref:CoA-transferase n=1 Tax=Gordonia soli NBRC 108243 TaxID=1223545 RepID=M0QNN4_9ACTN|nr:CoA transferase [Gordonia soli]GAC70193.1 hypothetical protein GS4_33_00070 [Gordonia soli NBRC 108243]